MPSGSLTIAITGASGFVGPQLVKLLEDAGANLRLIGRDAGRLQAALPGRRTFSYDELPAAFDGADIVVHLAVANNDAALSYEGFRAVNVELLTQVYQQASKAGVPRFLNISSTHALDEKNPSAYARTKREGTQAIQAINGAPVTTLFLPPVYGDRWAGKAAFLNKLPRALARLAFMPLAALTPTLNVRKLASYILNEAKDEPREQVILTDGQRGNWIYRTIMRTGDLAFAVLVSVFLWWLLLAIWIWIRIDSPGPGIFAQRRVGQHGREFTCYKFRTMKLGTVHAATNTVSESSVTKVGHFLRRSKLDELAQVWNIFRNELGLIGPRPCLPVQTELIEARRQAGVLAAKPGISGLAQVNHIDMSNPGRLAQWDARYIALQSLLLDLKIALATATGRGGGDRVAKD